MSLVNSIPNALGVSLNSYSNSQTTNTVSSNSITSIVYDGVNEKFVFTFTDGQVINVAFPPSLFDFTSSFLIYGTNSSTKFAIKNNSSNNVLLADTQNNIVSTFQNTLDDGSGNMTITGSATISSNSTISGNTTISQTLVANTNKLSSVDAFRILANSTINDTAFNVNTVSCANSSVGHDFQVDGVPPGYASLFYVCANSANGTVGTCTTMNNTLDDASGNIKISGNASITGGATISSDSTISGNTTISQSLVANTNKLSSVDALRIWTNSTINDTAFNVNTVSCANSSVGHDFQVDGVPPDYASLFYVCANSANGTVGTCTTMNNTLDDASGNTTLNGNLNINNTNGSTALTVNNNTNEVVTLNNILDDGANGNCSILGNVYPSQDGNSSCGQPSNRWSEIFCVDGTIQTSDANDKTNIYLLSSKFDPLTVINDLKPSIYNWKNDKTNKTHFGLIAQDVQSTLTKFKVPTLNGLLYVPTQTSSTTSSSTTSSSATSSSTTSSSATSSSTTSSSATSSSAKVINKKVSIKKPNPNKIISSINTTNSNNKMGINYSNIIPFLIGSIQSLSTQVNTLQATVLTLQNQINDLQ